LVLKGLRFPNWKNRPLNCKGPDFMFAVGDSEEGPAVDIAGMDFGQLSSANPG
jgi:hypothetical protein